MSEQHLIDFAKLEATVNARFDHLDDRVDRGFEHVDQRFDQTDHTKADHEERIRSLERKSVWSNVADAVIAVGATVAGVFGRG